MSDSDIDQRNLNDRLSTLEKRVNELELIATAIQQRQRKFYESTTNSIHDLQKTIRNVENDHSNFSDLYLNLTFMVLSF